MKCEICNASGKKITLKIKGHAGTFSWTFCDVHMIKAVDGEEVSKAEIEGLLAEARNREVPS